jgi:hypothetical protein
VETRITESAQGGNGKKTSKPPINVPLEQAGQLLTSRFFVLHIEEESGRSMLILELRKKYTQTSISNPGLLKLTCHEEVFATYISVAKLHMTFQGQSTDPCATNRTLMELGDYE